MATFTIYATRNSSATMRSRDTSSYSNARDGLDTGGNSGITGTNGFGMYVGQSDNSGTTGWSYDTTGLIFDTSGVSGTITSATLEIYVTSSTGTPSWDIEARVHSFGGAVTWPGDFVDADDLAAKTLVATLTKSAITSSAYNTFVDVALAANINAGGSTELILASSRSRTATEMAAGESERITFTSPLSPLGANGPRLIIETAAVPEGVLSKTIDAFTLASAATLPISGDVGATIADFTLVSTGEVIGVGQGSLNQSFANFTLSAAVQAETFAYFENAIAPFTLASAGAVAKTGDLAATIPAFTLSGEGAGAKVGVLDTSIGTFTLATSTAAGITGALTASIGTFSLSALQSGPAWPVAYSFPQYPLDGTWRRTLGDDTLRFDRKVGARNYREQDGGDYEEVEFAVMLRNDAQRIEMDRFYRDDCGNGSKPFYWPHPETGTVMAWTWTSPPALRHVAERVFRADVQLRLEAA